MPTYPAINFMCALHIGHRFVRPNPKGIVLHGTEAGYNHLLTSFMPGGTCIL